MKKSYFLSTIFLVVVALGQFACKKTDSSPPPTVVKQWTVDLATKNQVPAPANRNETGTAVLVLLSDNSLTYAVTVSGLPAGDAITAAHLHAGDVITNGGVILDFHPTFTNGVATGTITNLRSTLVDSLKNDVNEIYFNTHSTQVPGGLARGQLNNTIVLATDVALSGANENPAVATTANGVAILRLASTKQLYAKITVTNLESGDALTAAHIHKGAAGTNGAVYIGIYGSAADFGTVKTFTLDDATVTSLKSDALYVNAHSSKHGGGIIRGQIR